MGYEKVKEDVQRQKNELVKAVSEAVEKFQENTGVTVSLLKYEQTAWEKVSCVGRNETRSIETDREITIDVYV